MNQPLTAHEIKRYSRHLLLPNFGIEAQQRLKDAKVLVIGAGGLGSPILLYLAAAGIGTIGIVEHDTIDITNLQRQVLYDTASVGKPKITVATEKLAKLNPHTNLIAHNNQLTAQNALDILVDYDVIIDGSDNFPTRYLVNDACVLLNKPLIYGAIHQFEGQVAVFNYKGSLHYRDLFPTPPPPEIAPNCAEAGVLGVLPGIVGCLQANEAIKLIAQIGDLLINKMFIIDALTLITRTIKLAPLPDRPVINNLIDYEEFCGLKTAADITPQQLQQMNRQDYQLIDVREPHEYELDNLAGSSMPLSALEKYIPAIARDKTVVVHCQSGVRSLQAIEKLKNEYRFDNLFNLRGGLNAYRKMEQEQ